MHDYKTVAAFQSVVSDFPQRAGNYDLFQCAVLEAPASDVLHPLWNPDTLEVRAVPERPYLEPLQRGRKPDVLDCAPRERPAFPFFSVNNLLFPYLLQPVVQPDCFQLFAVLERAHADLPHTRRKNERLNPALGEAVTSYFPETYRKPNAAEAAATIEGFPVNYSQPASARAGMGKYSTAALYGLC